MIRPDLYKPNADGRFRQIFIRNTLFNQSARKLNLNISFNIFEKSDFGIAFGTNVKFGTTSKFYGTVCGHR